MSQLPGQMYAGRTLCYEDTVRDIEVAFGGQVLNALAGPPGPDQAWLPGPGGQRYFSELRMHMRNPVPAGPVEREQDR